MITPEKIKQFGTLVENSQTILLLQPDLKSVDADSIRSTLALARLFKIKGKKTVLYLHGPVPELHRIVAGSEQFTQEFPENYDLAILVDIGSPNEQMVSQLEKFGPTFSEKPFVVIDHHKTRSSTPFPSLELVDDESIATCEVIYQIWQELGWEIDEVAANHMIWSILADSGYTTYSKTYRPLVVLGELAKIGRPVIYDFYKLLSSTLALPKPVFEIKKKLMNQIEFHFGEKMAFLYIPKEMVMQAGDRLIKDFMLPEMRGIRGIELSVVLTEEEKTINGSARSLMTAAAGELARSFGGGGHDQAAGFTLNYVDSARAKKEVLAAADKILKRA